MTNPQKKPIGCLKIAVCAAALIIGLFLIGGGSIFWNIQRTQIRNTEELAAQRHPTSVHELTRYRQHSLTQQNATQAWQDAFEILHNSGFNSDYTSLIQSDTIHQKYLPLEKPWENFDTAQTLIKNIEAALAKIDEAEQMKGLAYFARDYSSLDTIYDDIGKLRSIARAVDLEAVVAVHRDDREGAGRALRNLAIVSEADRNAPLLVIQLIRMAHISMATHRTASLLPKIWLSTSDLTKIRVNLGKFDPWDTLQVAVDGERAFGLSSLRGEIGNLSVGFRIPGEESMLIKYYASFDGWKGIPLASWLPTAKKNDLEFKAYIGSRPWLPLLGYRVNSAIASESIVSSILNAACSVQLTDVMIAFELYRREHGTWPTSFESLVPKYIPSIPLDTFDGNTLRMLESDEGVTIYSVGIDLVNDRGQKVERWQQNEPSVQLPPADQMPRVDQPTNKSLRP